jgi:RNA polymerase sigma-70 factor (ECF subfamily)
VAVYAVEAVTVPRSKMEAVRSSPGSPPLDRESREWLEALRSGGSARDEAVARLHATLLRAARFEVARRSAAAPHVRPGDLDEIAAEAAADACVAVLRRLDDFRGASRFTTWAYKFALLEAAVKVRKRAWQGRELPLDEDAWEALDPPANTSGPAEDAERHEQLRALTAAIEESLTPHQRRVLLAVAVHGVPIDVLAERLGSTRGALYKTLHDARRKLRAELDEEVNE